MTTRTAVPIFGWTNRSSKPSRKRAPLTRSLPLRATLLEGILEEALERNRWLLQSDFVRLRLINRRFDYDRRELRFHVMLFIHNRNRCALRPV